MQLTSPWMTEQFWRKPSAADNGEYHSLALPAVFEKFGEDRKYRVLDLGPAHGLTVEFFSQFSCKLYVADLYRTLKSYGSFTTDEEDSRLAQVFGELLPYRQGTRFDLVLAWDLLNYLEPEKIEMLSRRLAGFSKAGTMFFAMIAIHQEIPARPCGFKILDAGTLEYDSNTDRTRSAPRHREPELCRLMPGFEVQSTFLLRNGLQEYVFVYNPYTARSSSLASEG